MKNKKRKRKNKFMGQSALAYLSKPESMAKLAGLTPEVRERAIGIYIFLSDSTEAILSGDIRRTEALRCLLRQHSHLAFMLDDMVGTYSNDDDVSIEGLTGADLKAAYQSHIVNPGSLN